MSFSVAAQNLARVIWNRTAKLYRRGRHWTLRRQKDIRESGKHARAQVKLGRERGRDGLRRVMTDRVAAACDCSLATAKRWIAAAEERVRSFVRIQNEGAP